MRLRDLFRDVPVAIRGKDTDISALICDSRRATPGSLFAALMGEVSDGHAYIADAVGRGATAVLCQREVDTRSATRVLSDNTRLALAVAARRFYADPSAALVMVGVTGTNGKTTTVHLVESMLEAHGMPPGIIGTLGSRHHGVTVETGLTTPESVDLVALIDSMRQSGVTAVAMEVSSHALAQERVAGLTFDVGVFTNLTHDHLDYHKTLDAYFKAKARLFHERLKPNGAAVLNFDDASVAALAGALPGARVLGFAKTERGPGVIYPETLSLDARGIAARVRTPSRTLDIHSPLVGGFNVENLLAAVAVGEALRMPDQAMVRGIAALKAVPGRLEPVRSNGPLVLVDYAHTPDALNKALAAARGVTAGRLMCVFGCGGDRDPHKRPLMGEVAARQADRVFITSDNPRREDPAAIIAAIEKGVAAQGRRDYHVHLDRRQAIGAAVKAASPGDVVLLAGKGHETYQIIGSDKLPFDDRQEARAALEAAGWETT
ncbi:MAG: UDP-N-acetylmuramoyl-L-alanyl-D-glutamate--2,6-diaminopimelate ligase [Deltaproteobacteria bacterium]|nr:UDP-N-acetylmuramoyl-L-alanyl-D-glutamate--2,6-diaminopimelate ligase [Deltaproteobacteria bacterium]